MGWDNDDKANIRSGSTTPWRGERHTHEDTRAAMRGTRHQEHRDFRRRARDNGDKKEPCDEDLCESPTSS